MTPDHAHFAQWDAAYALGALSPSDRRAFEAHLAECAECRRAVGELAVMPGLLSRVPSDRAQRSLADAVSPDPRLRADVVDAARRRRLRRRAGWAGVAAAGVLAIAAVAVPLAIGAAAPVSPPHALADVSDVPLEASVRLTDVAWGTRIDLVCQYSGEPLDAPEGGWPYALAVVGDDGATTTLSTWRSVPGSTTQLSAGTDLAVADIGAVEIRTLDGSSVLMRYRP
jgi:hypothetical protein